MEKIQAESYKRVVTKFEEFIRYCQKLEPQDTYLIVNRNSPILAEAAKKAAEDYGLNVKTFDLSARKPYKRFPKKLATMLNRKTPKAGMSLFNYSYNPDWNLKELGARIEFLYHIIEEVPISWAHAPGITLDMAVNGPLQCDYSNMAKDAESMLKELQNLKKIQITAPRGTTIEVEIPREVKPDSDCVIVPPNVYGKLGKFGNLPVGEVLLEKGKLVSVMNKETGKQEIQHYPIRLKANGKIVCDLSVGGYEGRINPEKPLTAYFENGSLIGIQCEDPKLDCIRKEILSSEKKYGLSTVLEEVGIGLNDRARITGNLLEDEKTRGTCHLAPGNVRCHVDMLIGKPTIGITYMDGTTREIMRDGILE